MKNAIIKLLIGTTLLGIAGYCLNLIFGSTIGFIEIHRENGVLFYTYKFFDYLENLRNSFTGFTDLSIQLPTRQYMSLEGNSITDQQFWQAMGNNMALLLDYLIFIINLSLWPLRLGAYALRAVLAIIGINVIPPIEHNLKWLVDTINNMIQFIQIPYV